ncbi:hypothetical protein H2203_002426 [Taxawa tesnikishii (nom. ined.)]|nr:hypothetical protein H2203_002426 [Dothideales sp. JES 119]
MLFSFTAVGSATLLFLQSVAAAPKGLQASASVSASASASEPVNPDDLCYANDDMFYTGQIFSDVNGVVYNVSCNHDNTAPGLTYYDAGHEGFTNCFAQCDIEPGCIGFSYIGGDTGRCYLKTEKGNNFFSDGLVTGFMVGRRPDIVLVPVKASASASACASAHA